MSDRSSDSFVKEVPLRQAARLVRGAKRIHLSTPMGCFRVSKTQMLYQLAIRSRFPAHLQGPVRLIPDTVLGFLTVIAQEG
jgi:hypothetical protein